MEEDKEVVAVLWESRTRAIVVGDFIWKSATACSTPESY